MIAGIAAIVSFIGAGLMLLLCLLGILHARRVSPTEELLHRDEGSPIEPIAPEALEPINV